MNISFQYASSIWSIIIWVPPYSQVQSKTVFKSWILFAAVKSAENRFFNSWATSYSVCGVKRLSSGPLADMPFGSNQMNRSQTRPRTPGWTKRRKTKICPELSVSIFENLNLGFPVFDVSRDLKGRIRIGLYRCFLNWNPCRSDKPINTLIKYTGHHKPFSNLKNLRVL